MKVTFIADSCHSGSLTRGAWNAQGKARSNSGRRGGGLGDKDLHEPVVNDPPAVDARTHERSTRKKAGVLTLAAAQSNEEAREIDTDHGAHGAFTWALSHALTYPNRWIEYSRRC